MSLSKKLTTHELESLYSAANSAIWHSHHYAVQAAKGKAREEDFVATLVTDGVPLLADRWISLLEPKGIHLKISGVFCHGHPQVEFGSPKCRVELADLLVVHQHIGKTRSSAKAILLQAKMSADATHRLPTSDPQLKLFSSWPTFEFVTGGMAPGLRNLAETGKGSRYALVLEETSYPEGITWADQCPWGTCPATQLLSADRSLAKLFGDMLLGKDGRTFQLGAPRDDWSRTIQELLQTTGKRTYRRANIGRGETPRLAEIMSLTSGTALFCASPQYKTGLISRSKRSVSERFFGAEPKNQHNDNDGGDGRFEEQGAPGGISTLIIETREDQREG